MDISRVKLASTDSPILTIHSLICTRNCVLWIMGLRHFIHDNFPMSQLTQTTYVSDINSVPIIDKIRVSLQRGDKITTPCQALWCNLWLRFVAWLLLTHTENVNDSFLLFFNFFSIMEKISFLVGFILIFNDVYGSPNIGMYT